jgi:hypothetical protein
MYFVVSSGMLKCLINIMVQEVKSRLNSCNACYQSVHNFLSSRLLSKNVKIKVHKTAILPAIWYGCETRSLILRKEHGLRVFENRVQRKIFGPNRGQIIWGWRKLHTEELHNLYSSPDIIKMIKSRRMRWAGHVACVGRKICTRSWWEARKKKTTRKI